MDDRSGKKPPPRRRLRSGLIVLFSSAWLAVLVAGWIFPGSGGSHAGKSVEAIRWTTGTWQRWDMFRTIPNLRSYEVELIGETASGEKRTFGALLPELKPLQGKRALRNHYALNRICDQPDEFFEGYVAQAARALRRADPEVVRFTIRIAAQPTRSFERSREDGRLWTTLTSEAGPFPVADD